MRKEVIFAIIIGLALGSVILYGLRLANQSAKEAVESSTSSAVIATITPTPTSESKLTVSEPANHTVVNTASVRIIGKSLPGSSVTIESAEDDVLTTADNSGNFDTDFKLTGGENFIRVTILLPDQKTESLEIVVIYTTAKLSSLTPPDLADVPLATDSQTIIAKTEEEILKNAKERSQKTEETLIAKANNLLVGYAGSITDIKQGVFSLDSRGANLQVSYAGTTAIVKDGVSLKPEQLALNDHAIVIGTQNGNDIIAAKRIVIFKETAPKYTKQTILSPITKIDTKKKTLTLSIGNESVEVTLGKLIKFDLTTLTISQKVFGIIMVPTTGETTLIQGKII